MQNYIYIYFFFYQHCYIIDNAYNLVLCNYIMCQDARNKGKINKGEKRLDEVPIVEGFCNCSGITKKVYCNVHKQLKHVRQCSSHH